MIVRVVNGWGSLTRSAIDRILDLLEQGEEVSIWNGYHFEMPKNWVDGPCSLKLRVGKRKRLIKGRITTLSDGWDDGGDNYNIVFRPNQPKVFKNRVISKVMED